VLLNCHFFPVPSKWCEIGLFFNVAHLDDEAITARYVAFIGD
jgi:hypothetical protein